MRKLSTALALAIAWIGAAQACPVLNEADAIQEAKADRSELQRLVRSTTKAADLVFLGRLAEATEQQVPAAEPPGAIDMTRHRLVFERVAAFKGFPPSRLELFWDEGPSIDVSCNAVAFFRQVRVLPTYRYIVYAKDGKILAASLVQDWPTGLTHDEELSLVRESE